MSSSRLPAAGATSLRHASRAFARPTLPSPLVRKVLPAAALSNAARSGPSEVGLVPHGRSGAGGAFPKRPTAFAAAAAAAVALASSSSQQEDGSSPVLAAGAYAIPIGRSSPDICNCFIEVSRESRMKYEWDEETNMLKLDRVLHGAAFYPHDYGFIPQTLCGDGDPLDVLVLGTSALQPGSIVEIRALGYMVMEDEKGLDEKVLAVPDKDPRFNHMASLRDVPEHVLREITNFFETYKQLEKSKWVKVGGWRGTTDTHELIEQTHKRYLEKTRRKSEDHVSPAAITTASASASASAVAAAAERRVNQTTC